MRGQEFLQIRNFFQQDWQGPKLLLDPALRWTQPTVESSSEVFSLGMDLIVNNGWVIWHLAWWVRQLSKRGNRAFGQKNRTDFSLICFEKPQKLQKLQLPDVSVPWSWHRCGWQVVIWAVRAAAHSLQAGWWPKCANWPAPSDFSAEHTIGAVLTVWTVCSEDVREHSCV